MPPSRRKGASKAAAAAAACKKWKVGDLVLAKVKGFPAWPATVSEPEKWGYSTDWKKVLVYFFGTQQIAFCNPADVEAFTEEKKESLLIKRQGKGADFVRAVQEIIDSYEKSKKQDQVDAINSGDEVTLTNAGNAVDSSANVGLKVQTETPEVALDSRSNTSYSARDNLEPIPPVEDAPAATQINALHDEETLLEKHQNDVVVKKEPLIATYSSRKRSVGLRSQSRVTQRMALSVRRSRSSSRYQNFVQLCNAEDKCVRDIETNVVQDVCSRMSKRNRKSPDASDLHDEDSIAFISNDSMEDNGSEIATVDSDTFSLNESNTIDSGCKLENSETVVECIEGDVELRKGLDLQIKAVVIKKKRKPNRKRVTNDTTRSTAGLDREEGGVHNSGQNSQNTCEILNEKCSKEDGDEHLPLVKRARVRMGKISAVDEQNSSRTEVKPVKDVAVNLSDQISTPLESASDNAATRNFLLLKGASDNVSLSKGCSQFSENMHQLKTVKRNQSFGCSADGEAALPPSKRLHRALEAMSANAAEEGQACNEALAAAKTFNNGSCDSSMGRCTHIAMESKAENGLRLQSVDSLGNNASQVGASGFSTSLNPIISEELIKSPPGIDICNQPIKNYRNQDHEFCKEVLAEAMEFNDGKDRSGSSFGAHTTRTAAQTQSPEFLSPSLDRRLTSLRSGQGSLDQSTSSNEEGNTENDDLNNYRSDNGDKDLDASEHTGMSPDPGSRDNGIDKILPQNCTGLLQYCAEGVGCENVGHLNPEIDDNGHINCQVSSKCEVVKEVEHNQMQKSASVASDEVDMRDRDGLAVLPSPSPNHGVESPARMSPPDISNCHTSTSDIVPDEEGKGAIQRPRFVGKRNNYEEAHAALSSYGAMLGTLTRTKESIGRATRMAIDCAKKFGNGSKVLEILACTLESESNLHRRVDLFFLVDSITQCARGLKGDDGGIYPSAIQALLPRLLLAAAPPGHTAQENRRQCLKVLRLWLERRILPESIIRHHMRELDPFSGSSSGAFSRRSSRTERPLDDPVRDMEGMLVDEYGSNSSFQIPGFCMPRMLKDEDEGSDSDDESFEAVTPEHNIETPEEREAVPAIDKHRHILEDVDGEVFILSSKFKLVLGSPQSTSLWIPMESRRMNAWPAAVLLIAIIAIQICFSYSSSDELVFYEPFDVSFQGRWTMSDKDDYQGIWKHSKSEGHDDYGLLVSEKARKYAIVSELDEVLSLKDGTVVLQFEVRLQNGLECGGAYLKYLRPQEVGWKPKEFDNNSPYSIMFGPDKCGSTNKVHFILKHKNPKSGEYVEHHLKYPPSVPSDKLSHIYTAILKPDNELRILIDGEEKKKANFLSSEDFEPALIPAKTIPDPNDKKPEDWDERTKIPDPDAVKPDDWDEDAPLEIEDEAAVKPEGWLDDEPEEIDDPDAVKPEDWDDEEDGEWEAPKADNPKCESAPGCGEWKRPMKPNPAYKGKWHAPLIDNPSYKGIWKPQEIPNPDYFEIEKPDFEPIAAIGIEIWTMQDGILFDNILISRDEKAAESYRETTWKPKFEVEKEKQKAEEAAVGSDGLSGFQKVVFDLLYKVADIPFLEAYRPKISDLIEKAEQQPNVTIGILVSVVIVIVTVFIRILFGGKKPVVNVTETDSGVAAETSNQGSTGEKEDENEEKEDTAAAPRRRSTRREN